MLAEHIIYSCALAIMVGMVALKYTGRDHSWIIILCAWAPDIDILANPVLNQLGFTLLYEGHKIVHGGFHNIAIMVIFGIAVAFLLHPLGIKFLDSFVYSVIGFGAHLFEDALVYRVGYRFLWPLSSNVMGLGILTEIQSEEDYIRNFFGIANTGVLIMGLVLLCAAVLIRTRVEGRTWLRWYIPSRLYTTIFTR
ncbi:metal-dependent hydrolase [Methanosphaerula subterraneus]|uniref:metal-dependent hydrolase n=1 Tax=Methanosphaerula subterraneus TaxID=3350244 RepID=UPI003F835C25